MSELYFNFLEEKRQKIFLQLNPFSPMAVLGGGTALCMQLNHRKSYDFDLFVKNPIEKALLTRVIKIFGKIKILVDSTDELSFLTSNQVKVSFIYFPFKHLYPLIKTQSLSIFDWKDIAVDKAYVVGRRGEYRDYADISFILRKGLKLERIIKDAEQKFKHAFSAKLFLGQLVYFDDLREFTADFIGPEYSPEQVKHSLEKAVSKYIQSN